MAKIGEQMLYEAGVKKEEALVGFHWPPLTSVPHLHLHVIAPQSDMNFLHRLQFKSNSYWFVSVCKLFKRL